MFNGLPIRPIRSVYFFGVQSRRTIGVPLLASYTEENLDAIPLAHLDRASVVMAYLRGVFGIFVVFGSMSIIAGIGLLAGGKKPDAFGQGMITVLLILLATGSVFGGLTYLFARATKREKAIRQCCAEILGAPIDPANILPERSIAMEKLVVLNAEHQEQNIRTKLLFRLIEARVKIAQSIDVARNEQETDEILTLCRSN